MDNYIKPQECVSERRDKENRELYSRNVPSHLLQPYINVRPVMTKYSYLPVVDPRKEISTGLVQQPTYSVSQVFNPGNAMAPWSGFASNINLESDLRNQVFALQKCSQAVYVPSSKSDLYEVSVTPSQNIQQNHPLLFKEEHFVPFNPNPDSNMVGTNLFHNCTKVQVRDIICDYKKQ